ncbi:MAG TPA: hypothetical protein DD413_02330 [Ruminococcus sp.]|nr:hypothetical protein [Ruminococcus sp.]
MRKSKKIFTGLICVVISLSSVLPIFAEEADDIEPRVAALQCPQCLTGTAYVHEINRELTGFTFADYCIHGTNGVDTIYNYTITKEVACNSCTFRDTYSSKKDVYVCNSK